MDENDDYPPDQPQLDPPPFPEPILDCCVVISAEVLPRNGERQFFPNSVIVKNGLSAPYNQAGDLNDDVSDDGSVSSNSVESQSDEEDLGNVPKQKPEIAYLMREEIREAIFGRVTRAAVLRRANENDVWTETNEECAIKEMPWDEIRNGLVEGRSENPQSEIAAMQHLMRFYTNEVGGEHSASDAMHDTGIIMPLDFLYDHQNLYIITPFCSGGELFDVLDTRTRFTEDESRNILRNLLQGLEWLHRAGLTHKDISLENIMVDADMTVIIDMGMCLRIPSSDDNTQRFLIRNRHRCGKMRYMAPEVFNQEPFDGRAVDMWAAGVCLFMMLTGMQPWNRPSQLDERFRYFTNGYLTPVLTSWNMNLSADAIDLLQRMLFRDPHDRLSLEQVRNHPWMM